MYGVLILTFGLAIVTGILVYFLLIPFMRKKILKETEEIKSDKATHLPPVSEKSSHVTYTNSALNKGEEEENGTVEMKTVENEENGNCVVEEGSGGGKLKGCFILSLNPFSASQLSTTNFSLYNTYKI